VLTKIALRPGVSRENTRYTSENGWWLCDKVRFRQGTPESIGGWVRVSGDTYLGIARALHVWLSLSGRRYVGVGTHLKYYIETDGQYYDITPLRETQALTDPFSTTNGSAVVLVTDTGHGAITGDYVTYSGATAVGGLTLNGEFAVTVVSANQYTITAPSPASGTATGGGSVTAAYQLSIGAAVATPVSGWSSGAWGIGAWGVGEAAFALLRLWSHGNFGEDLIYCPRGGALYMWDASAANPLTTRGVPVSGLPGASDVPATANSVLVSDVSRFVFAFGCPDVGSSTIDPLLVRWSDQESMVDWTPSALNQAGGLRLSIGSEIVARQQLRQEVLVWTDAALYSMQYLGPPAVWGAQLMGDNISIAGPNAVATAVGAAFWMGNKKFYTYNGQVQTLKCDLLQYVFTDFNEAQALQVFAGTVEEYNEIWWFYPSVGSTAPNKYVVYNYAENIWYMGEMTRYAWLDNGILESPLAAGEDRLVLHEQGVDDQYDAVPAPIHSFIESAAIEMDDGDRFMLVRKVFPDVTFTGSTGNNPQITLTLIPMKSSGAPYGSSVGGEDTGDVVRGVSMPVETFTQQLYLRIRGRQVIMRIDGNTLGTKWQAGAMRFDIRPDGLRG
jgi:hypothetical protein